MGRTCLRTLMLLAGSCSGLIAVGCSNTMSGSMCGSLEIEPSAQSNAVHEGASELVTCETHVEGDLLFIDLFGSGGDDPLPRVLVVLTVENGAGLPLGTFDLARGDDLREHAPATYQEYVGPSESDPRRAEGSFWTATSGTLEIRLDEAGRTVAEFSFEADNPLPAGESEGTGNVSVSGAAVLSAGM